MTALLLTWLFMAGLATDSRGPASPPAPAAQTSRPLRLDVRVFDGLTDVTRDTVVSLFDAGRRDHPRRVPLMPSGERQITLPPGQYDLQLIHQDDGRVLGVRWTSLRLLVDYPGEHGRHLEVVNLRKGFGALQLRRAGGAADAGPITWTATLRPVGGGDPVATAPGGDGYALFVAPPGRYDVSVRTATGATHVVGDVAVREDLTYLKSWD